MRNLVVLVGRVGKNPETRQTEKTNIVNFSLATSEKYKDNETTTWHNIVMFGKLAEIAEKYLKKGDLVYLEGKIQNRNYEKGGETKYISEVVANQMTMLGQKNKPDSDDLGF